MVRWLGSGFGFGLSPVAPGTCGTLLGVALAFALRGWPWAAPVAAFGLAVVAIPLASAAERAAGRADPPSFVLDEVAGYLLAVAFLPPTPLVFAGSFLAFRLFDIGKPWPARSAEKLPGGSGVVADDLVAGAYAQAAVRLALLL
ncbi:MAG: phosphatidylglycerophosphatase A family protein [Planctomycetota bacterium]